MLIVKKFGGTSVANKERIYNVANRCVEEYKKGNDVVVVLSAMGKYTDELISMAEDINEKGNLEKSYIKMKKIIEKKLLLEKVQKILLWKLTQEILRR